MLHHDVKQYILTLCHSSHFNTHDIHDNIGEQLIRLNHFQCIWPTIWITRNNFWHVSYWNSNVYTTLEREQSPIYTDYVELISSSWQASFTDVANIGDFLQVERPNTHTWSCTAVEIYTLYILQIAIVILQYIGSYSQILAINRCNHKIINLCRTNFHNNHWYAYTNKKKPTQFISTHARGLAN